MLIRRGKSLLQMMSKRLSLFSRSESETDPYVDLKKLALAGFKKSIEQLVSNLEMKPSIQLPLAADNVKSRFCTC
jgi:hypothetical protein